MGQVQEQHSPRHSWHTEGGTTTFHEGGLGSQRRLPGRQKRDSEGEKKQALLSQASTRGCDKEERQTVSKQTSAGVTGETEADMGGQSQTAKAPQAKKAFLFSAGGCTLQEEGCLLGS